MKVKEICDYSGSTLLGMNGGMVESPRFKKNYICTQSRFDKV